MIEALNKKIDSGKATVGVIGLGYVGLPLAVAFAKRFPVVGYDKSQKVVASLKAGISHIMDVPSSEIKKVNKRFTPTCDDADLKKCDFMIICVPTPLEEDKNPDMSYIEDACEMISRILRPNQFIILESTTYPGTTDDVMIPILEKSGLSAGKDFGAAYSPERVDPGNKDYGVEDIPKVVGGINQECTETAAKLYATITKKVVKVRDPKTAETVKMTENIFRNINIALVNELSLIMERMGIDAWEVIDAAKTKPYGFMAFYPGPGVGGHCIPLDPFYMSYIAKRYGFIPRFIETAGEINEFMEVHVINLIEKGLAKDHKRIRGSKIALLGLAYKKNIEDTRESPTIKIIEELTKLGAQIKAYDPYVKSTETKTGIIRSEKSLDKALTGSDCAVFIVDHDAFKKLRPEDVKSPVVVDCKNIFKNFKKKGTTYLGLGKDNTRI